MLLEFKVKNYKSFVDEMVFSMIPAPKQTGLDYSLITEKIGSKRKKALCSAVIYGPNASGKTNLIGAMETFKTIVLRGNVENSDVSISPNVASSALELIPNCYNHNEPTSFSISFVEAGMQISYNFSVSLGPFLNKDFSRKILSEKLTINDKLVFERGENLVVNLPVFIKHFANKGIKRISPKILEIAASGLSNTELFLTNGFKSIFAQELVFLITKWFSEKFTVIYRSDGLKVMRKLADPKKNAIYVETTLTKAAKEFGINSNALGYRASNDEDDVILCSIFNNNVAIPADTFESYGTIRFINEFPLIIKVLLNGGTLVMDEFDASIHPMALMNIISIFHNDDLNKNHAQLIFNTHNPIFLDSSLFRRDEIKFVERDSETNRSILYSLSDFKTANGVRKGEDYMNNYFAGRYGAIKDVDFSSIIETIISQSEVI